MIVSEEDPDKVVFVATRGTADVLRLACRVDHSPSSNTHPTTGALITLPCALLVWWCSWCSYSLVLCTVSAVDDCMLIRGGRIPERNTVGSVGVVGQTTFCTNTFVESGIDSCCSGPRNRLLYSFSSQPLCSAKRRKRKRSKRRFILYSSLIQQKPCPDVWNSKTNVELRKAGSDLPTKKYWALACYRQRTFYRRHQLLRDSQA